MMADADDDDNAPQATDQERPYAHYAFAFSTLLPFFIALWLSSVGIFKDSEEFNEQAIKYFKFIGIACFALTGTLTAGAKGMDLLGCAIIGVTNALGGGTLRDMLLGRFPIGWMVDFDELVLCIVVVCITFFGWQRFSRIFGLAVDQKWIFFSDCLGLAVFTAVGAQIGFNHGVNIFGCAICGLITATFGGVARDVLCQSRPRIFYSANGSELYAVPALVGGFASAFTRAYILRTDHLSCIFCGVFVATFLRTYAWNKQVVLPSFESYISSGKRRDGEELLVTQVAGPQVAGQRRASFASVLNGAPFPSPGLSISPLPPNISGSADQRRRALPRRSRGQANNGTGKRQRTRTPACWGTHTKTYPLWDNAPQRAVHLDAHVS
jgi:uncharacterized membrane protein YeiH